MAAPWGPIRSSAAWWYWFKSRISREPGKDIQEVQEEIHLIAKRINENLAPHNYDPIILLDDGPLPTYEKSLKQQWAVPQSGVVWSSDSDTEPEEESEQDEEEESHTPSPAGGGRSQTDELKPDLDHSLDELNGLSRRSSLRPSSDLLPPSAALLAMTQSDETEERRILPPLSLVLKDRVKRRRIGISITNTKCLFENIYGFEDNERTKLKFLGMTSWHGPTGSG
ncbi:hypothetical protein HPP92_016563 [Vanilla planifolia]|uniref:Uncharacterized protein n=1 Tax=Vanilla planifolia TaxID=51239 RepID=A0A835QQI4_VANPL|nr:hypothetical protein HPP92_016563 [Vanilla planifolia]